MRAFGWQFIQRAKLTVTNALATLQTDDITWGYGKFVTLRQVHGFSLGVHL